MQDDQWVINATNVMRAQCSPRGSYRQVPALDMRLERTLKPSHHYLPELAPNLDAPNKYTWSPF